jgi:hypothetical protein
VSIRYESTRVALADQILAAWYGLKRQRLTHPHACDQCGRTATTVPMSRAVTATGTACRRVRWSLQLCPGRLTKAATS